LAAISSCPFRSAAFLSADFRQAHARLSAADQAQADRGYLRLLELAHQLGEDAVAAVLGAFLREGGLPDPDAVKARLVQPAPSRVAILPFVPSLRGYDALLKEVAS
jgi:hypothetical protein